jgi:hypothetical protein
MFEACPAVLPARRYPQYPIAVPEYVAGLRPHSDRVCFCVGRGGPAIQPHGVVVHGGHLCCILNLYDHDDRSEAMLG